MTPFFPILTSLKRDLLLINASGMSFPGCTTQRLVKKINFSVNVINPIAGNVPEAAQTPLPLGNDRQAVEVAPQKSDFPNVSASSPPGKGKKLHGTV